jgi:hypothetical protein
LQIWRCGELEGLLGEHIYRAPLGGRGYAPFVEHVRRETGAQHAGLWAAHREAGTLVLEGLHDGARIELLPDAAVPHSFLLFDARGLSL